MTIQTLDLVIAWAYTDCIRDPCECGSTYGLGTDSLGGRGANWKGLVMGTRILHVSHAALVAASLLALFAVLTLAA
jgi:hypothetical protein